MTTTTATATACERDSAGSEGSTGAKEAAGAEEPWLLRGARPLPLTAAAGVHADGIRIPRCLCAKDPPNPAGTEQPLLEGLRAPAPAPMTRRLCVRGGRRVFGTRGEAGCGGSLVARP